MGGPTGVWMDGWMDDITAHTALGQHPHQSLFYLMSYVGCYLMRHLSRRSCRGWWLIGRENGWMDGWMLGGWMERFGWMGGCRRMGGSPSLSGTGIERVEVG